MNDLTDRDLHTLLRVAQDRIRSGSGHYTRRSTREMVWQNIIANLIVQLLPVFEQWFITWLETRLKALAPALPPPASYSGVLVSTVNPVSDANKLLLLYEARASTYVWNVRLRSAIDRAIETVKGVGQ